MNAVMDAGLRWKEPIEIDMRFASRATAFRQKPGRIDAANCVRPISGRLATTDHLMACNSKKRSPRRSALLHFSRSRFFEEQADHAPQTQAGETDIEHVLNAIVLGDESA